MAHLQLKNLNKIYDNGFHAVHDFCMEIEKGEFVVFVGPSGCGKSTTLRMLAGLEEITGGTLLINGDEANAKTPRERGVAMVFQSYALYPHMSVYENLAFGLSLKGIDEDVVEGRVLHTAKILGLTNYLNRPPRELSGGQRQRVAVGRAIIRHVDVFLMDEPLSNLDAKQRVTMRAEIVHIHRKVGATTVYVTHDQTEAMTMADRIVVMKDGYVQQIGTPHELYFSPVNRFVAGFIGEPPMNFLPCKVERGAVVPDGTNCRIDLSGFYKNTLAALEGKSVVMGFRPEAVQAAPAGCGAPEMPCAELEARVTLTEFLGDSVNVYGEFGESKVILRVSPYEEPAVSEQCRFRVPCENVYLFDQKTEATLHG